MAYRIDLKNSAIRHFEAGEHLCLNSRRKDVAGYLFGIAAECAVKEIMRRMGMLPLENRRDDPFYAHFPELKTMLRNNAQGRGISSVMNPFIQDSFMQEWDTDMRYAPSGDIASNKVERWHEQAKKALDVMNGF